MKKKKLTFFSLGEEIFLRDIIIDLRKDYDIKFFHRGDQKEFHQLLHDTDIAWFEWCDQLIQEASNRPKMCKYVCRLHSYELFTDMPSKVDWNNVDKLFFVNPIVRDYSLKKFGIRPDITQVILNGVNIEKFTIPEKKKYNKKIAFVGLINYKKGPELLLQTLKAIYDYDPTFEFHIAGGHQDERIHLYMDNFLAQMPFKVNFDGWQDDMPKYLEDKDYIISTSLFESFQYAIAEGMAQGLVPLVHNWIGSDFFYPKENIFVCPEDAIQIIRKFEDLTDKNKKKYRESMRAHIVNNFTFERQIADIRKALEEL